MSTTKCFCNISKTTLTLLSILGFLLFAGEQMCCFIHTQNIHQCSRVSENSSSLAWICKEVCMASSIICKDTFLLQKSSKTQNKRTKERIYNH